MCGDTTTGAHGDKISSHEIRIPTVAFDYGLTNPSSFHTLTFVFGLTTVLSDKSLIFGLINILGAAVHALGRYLS